MQAYQYPATPVVTGKQLAAARSAARRERALASIAHRTAGERNATASHYGVSGRWVKVTVLASKQRRPKVAVAKGAKRAKRQRTGGNVPVLAATRWSYV